MSMFFSRFIPFVKYAPIVMPYFRAAAWSPSPTISFGFSPRFQSIAMTSFFASAAPTLSFTACKDCLRLT